jgi:hypothetical protein
MKSFLVWLEGEESPALSEPQHKQGEANMGLDSIVERRMKQIIMELEGSGKGTQQEILASVQKYLKAKGVQAEKPASQPPQDDAQGAQQDGMQMQPAMAN